MRPFVSRFTLLLGLLFILTGILLIVENKASLAWVFIPVGIVTFVISFFNVFRKEPEHEAGVFIQPDAEEFEDETDADSSNKENER
jgi:membrane-bound ClpP family serine protease